MTGAESNISTVRSYLAALQRGDAGDQLRRFFTEDVLQVEMPNRLNARGQQSNLEQILARSEQGVTLLQRQQYEIVSATAQDDRVAIEARWTGVLAVAVASLSPGDQMTASFAIFFQFRDGLIAQQTNYDCFDPW